MSDLRSIRLLVASRMEASTSVKHALIDFLNQLDESLDVEGYDAPENVKAAMRRLDKAIATEGDDVEIIEDDDLIESENDEVEYVDLEDIEDMNLDDEDNEDEDDD